MRGERVRLTDAFPAPGAARPPAQPSGSTHPVRGTGRAELSGFGNARNVTRHSPCRSWGHVEVRPWI